MVSEDQGCMMRAHVLYLCLLAHGFGFLGIENFVVMFPEVVMGFLPPVMQS